MAWDHARAANSRMHGASNWRAYWRSRFLRNEYLYGYVVKLRREALRKLDAWLLAREQREAA